MKKVFSYAGLFFLLCVNSCFAQVDILKGRIQIKGSDTMVNLAQAWAEAFMQKYPNVSVALTGGGSGTGIASFLNGTCDIAQSSRQMKEKEVNLARAKGTVVQEHIVALDGIAVVVHPGNPIGQMSLAELRDIFMGTLDNWKQLGGPDASILILSREVNSGTHLFFKEHVLRRGDSQGKEEFAPQALLLPSSQAIADEVAGNKYAIGYYGMGYISSKQKALAVVSDKNSDYFLPTLENVLSGRYPISRPLYMYTRTNPSAVVKAFLDFVFSPEGQAIVEKIDFVPVNPSTSLRVE